LQLDARSGPSFLPTVLKGLETEIYHRLLTFQSITDQHLQSLSRLAMEPLAIATGVISLVRAAIEGVKLERTFMNASDDLADLQVSKSFHLPRTYS
jgi:hypothetical protein